MLFLYINLAFIDSMMVKKDLTKVSQVQIKQESDVFGISECHVTYQSAQALKSRLCTMSLSDDKQVIEAAEWIGCQMQDLLSEEVLLRIKSFSESDQESALIIRGLPLGDTLPPTPYEGFIENDELLLANAIHTGIYNLAGFHPIAYEHENNGRIFRHVVPTKDAKGKKSSHGSDVTFGFHVDKPDLPIIPESLNGKSACPELLSLMAIRSDLKVNSSVVLLDDVLSRLNQGVIQILMSDQFLISRPDSFSGSLSSRLPVLAFDRNNVAYSRYDKENVTPITPQAAAALLMFEAALEKPENVHSTVFLPGDMLLIKNQRTLHRREAYIPREDGADRWLIRLFGMKSKQRLLSLPNCSHIGKD
ncbi:TauD/TfdA family dioxygenase [Marinomonas communis]|uniref:TfdA family taurine catabolism dioxygenase TauD n=1 Tax=Marinomonas communis TaxID=28254 RepID=A0A4V3DFR7_9GAMM|nr:TauD/TfdA family dioxygenase [Marinomonas communis]TDR06370.1 TfdA family taurine catabolism dioxygenase TauD [Marinomonas communis]